MPSSANDMNDEPLHVFVKERLVDEPSDDEQRNLLALLFATYGPKTSAEGSVVPRLEPSQDADFLDRLYSAGGILPRAYCYLSFCMKLLQISATGQRKRSRTERLWGYVLWCTMDDKAHASFDKALQADADQLRDKHGPLSEAVEDALARRKEPKNHPLKSVASSMVQAMILDNDRAGLRELIRWVFSAHEPYLKRLLDESHDVGQWLTNVAELIPRLLIKNILPLHDAVAVRSPNVQIGEYTSSGRPQALHDPGLIERRSTFIRNLFTEREAHNFEQMGQRISEVFAHAYPLLLIEQPDQELSEWRERIFETARNAGRLKALQQLEMHHHYDLRLPTWFYRELKAKLTEPTT
jgi:hypothetical protein